MGNLVLNGQTVLEQVGTAKPTVGTGFPSGHVIQTTTPSIYTGANTGTANRTQLGSLSIWYHDPTKMTNTITKQYNNSFLLVHFCLAVNFIGNSGSHSIIVFIDESNYMGILHDVARNAYSTDNWPVGLSYNVPFTNINAGTYEFNVAVCRGTDADMNYQRNGKDQSDEIDSSYCSSWMYIQEIMGN